MKAVLYANDFEPITVIQIEPWAYQFLIKTGNVRLAVHPRQIAMFDPQATPVMEMNKYIVNITAERIRRGPHEALMLFTNDEEAALLLKAAFLPGQYFEVQERESDSFAKGLLHAINSLGDR